MDFLNQPFARDTSPNSAGEILRRVGIILNAAGLLLGPVLLAIGAVRDDRAMMIGGGALLGLGLGLQLTQARWKNTRVPGTAPRMDPGAVAVPSSTPPRSGARRPRLLLLNASLAGPEGNSARLLGRLAARLAPQAELVGASLAGPGAQTFATLVPALRAADGVVIATGTHWDGWSSPLQKFLEDATPAEATALWLGKPAAVLVSEHSTGGKGVLSRLQGVLVTLGCTLPPLSGLVIAKSAQIAGRVAPTEAEDFWSAADLEVVADNLLVAARQPRAVWRTWPVDRTDYARAWVE